MSSKLGRFDFAPASPAVRVEMLLGSRLWQHLEEEGQPWWQRLSDLSRQWQEAYGLPFPGLHFQEDLDLPPCRYRFRLNCGAWEEGQVYPGLWFATGLEGETELLLGERAQDPVYGLPGCWIPASSLQGAESLGCHLIAPETLWVGHLSQRLEAQLCQCLCLDWLKQRLPGLGSSAAAFYRHLYQLLQEKVGIAQLERLWQAYRAYPRNRLSAMRKAVADQMLLPWKHSQLLAVSLTDQCAKRLKEVLPSGGGWYVYHFLEQLLGEVEWVRQQGGNPVILAPDSLRRSLFELLPAQAGLTVFGYEEIPPSLEFEVAAVVGSQLHPDQRHWPGRRFVSDSFQGDALP